MFTVRRMGWVRVRDDEIQNPENQRKMIIQNESFSQTKNVL